MKNKKILFIVEGSSESEFIQRTLSLKKSLSERYEIVEYKTSIYELYDLLIKNPDVPLQSLLFLENKIDSDLRNKWNLELSFSYTYLIFDFDPQYHKFGFDKIEYLADRFSDSSTEGQLFLNYPMFESLYDIDPSFSDASLRKYVSVKKSKKYKSEVKKTSFLNRGNQFQKHIVDLNTFERVSEFNLKRYKILNSVNDFLGVDQKLTLNNETEILQDRGELFVLNTSSLLYFEFQD